jgi:hypothetical protein
MFSDRLGSSKEESYAEVWIELIHVAEIARRRRVDEAACESRKRKIALRYSYTLSEIEH